MAGIANEMRTHRQNLFVLELIPRIGLTYDLGNVQFAPLAVVALDNAPKKE
jgi:hypothetical protein